MELTATETFLDGLKAWRNLKSGSDGELRQPIDGLPDGLLERDAPVSYAAYIDLSRKLKAAGQTSYSLENMLRGARVYIVPPPPKTEPTPEYKALMARLRREEEERTYQRMLQPAPAHDIPQSAHTYAAVHRPTSKEDEGDDDVSYGDVHRQLMLVLNFLVSIIGVAATLWILARWWSTPARLFLTMAGSVVVAIAEVGVYWGYIWSLGEAKKKQTIAKEERKIMQTWVVGQDEKDAAEVSAASKATEADGMKGVRRRKKEPT